MKNNLRNIKVVADLFGSIWPIDNNNAYHDYANERFFTVLCKVLCSLPCFRMFQLKEKNIVKMKMTILHI